MSEAIANLCTSDACEALRARLAKYEDGDGRPLLPAWNLSAAVLPACGKPVLAYYLNSHGKGRRIRAEYVKSWTVQVDDLSDPDTECVDYSEQDDAYYIREGWYELIDNWDEYSRIAVHEGVITHWQELTPAPSADSATGVGDGN